MHALTPTFPRKSLDTFAVWARKNYKKFGVTSPEELNVTEAFAKTYANYILTHRTPAVDATVGIAGAVGRSVRALFDGYFKGLGLEMSDEITGLANKWMAGGVSKWPDVLANKNLMFA